MQFPARKLLLFLYAVPLLVAAIAAAGFMVMDAIQPGNSPCAYNGVNPAIIAINWLRGHYAMFPMLLMAGAALSGVIGVLARRMMDLRTPEYFLFTLLPFLAYGLSQHNPVVAFWVLAMLPCYYLATPLLCVQSQPLRVAGLAGSFLLYYLLVAETVINCRSSLGL